MWYDRWASEIGRVIEVVITGLTRNPPRLRLFRPPVSLCFQGLSRVLKTKYFAVLTRRSNILVFLFFEVQGVLTVFDIHGEVSKWS